ncbi:hypothetical protein [Oceanicoccus sp. KOV_DT_Chl]|uniref:hypothetical protein n=1 Tax=Oceanicoccus sp. KOV_DT_Chl TaxID=1904639 RepID=UPI001F285045|nr:hypothetical protein [Oceanicoccus sp. KOV_DT_Chl]
MATTSKITRPFAVRLQDIEPFRVVEVLDRAKQLAAEGRDIVHLEAGSQILVRRPP